MGGNSPGRVTERPTAWLERQEQENLRREIEKNAADKAAEDFASTMMEGIRGEAAALEEALALSAKLYLGAHLGTLHAQIADLKREASVYIEPWQPIATAPRDGTPVDLLREHVICLGCHWGDIDVPYSQSAYKGWVMGLTDWHPTHWRPAAPPQKKIWGQDFAPTEADSQP